MIDKILDKILPAVVVLCGALAALIIVVVLHASYNDFNKSTAVKLECERK